jgi:hypothetical protein
VTGIQREANRRNALKSTGPKTVKGNAKAKMNALKHGLTAEQIVIPNENAEEFDALMGMLATELQPTGVQERHLVERIAAILWRLRRVYSIEAGVFTCQQARAQLNAAWEEIKTIKSYSKSGLDPNNWVDILDNDDDKQQYEAVVRARKAQRILVEASGNIGAAFLSDAGTSNALTKLSRYEVAIDRLLYKARHELERLQAARKGVSVTPPVTIDVIVDHENLPGPEGA